MSNMRDKMPALLQQAMGYIKMNGFVFLEHRIIIDICKFISSVRQNKCCHTILQTHFQVQNKDNEYLCENNCNS